MSGSLVISLDFELMWGVRDHRTVKDYGDAVIGGREAIPHILARFEGAGIRASWATVGLLFAKNRREMLEYAPTQRPTYRDESLSPYVTIEKGEIGEDEATDPLHFGASLIDKIASTPGQEVATHTYSHFYCMEQGADGLAFQADLRSAIAIAKDNGHALSSIVYPRNQWSTQFVELTADVGLKQYRGAPKGWLYQPRSGTDTTSLFRLIRFTDGALPIGPKQVVDPITDGSLLNVPASRFLRPWSPKLAVYNELHLRRIENEMTSAARQGGCYHLWWHPHNFGRNLSNNLKQLDRIISCFKYCQDELGMVSDTMKRAKPLMN